MNLLYSYKISAIFFFLIIFSFSRITVYTQEDIEDPCKELQEKYDNKSPSTSMESDANTYIPAINPSILNDFINKKWNVAGKRKMLIITATTQLFNPKDNFNIDDLDSHKIAEIFRDRLGYEILEPIYSGEKVIQDEILDRIKQIKLKDSDSLLIYIIAHGKNADGDLNIYLHTGSTAMNRIIAAITGNPKIKGKISIIIDTCNSGKALENKVTTAELNNIGLFAAVSKSAKEIMMKDVRAPAFSYYLVKALKDEWDDVDDKPDGFITYGELKNYLKIRLNCARKSGKLVTSSIIDENSDGEILTDTNGKGIDDTIIAFNPLKVKEKSNYWKVIIMELAMAYKDKQLIEAYGGNILIDRKPDFYVEMFPDSMGRIAMKSRDKLTNTARASVEPRDREIETKDIRDRDRVRDINTKDIRDRAADTRDRDRVRDILDRDINNTRDTSTKTSTILKPDLEKFHEFEKFLLTYKTEITINSEDKYERAVQLLLDNKYNESIILLTEIENTVAEKREQIYITLGLAQRFNGKLEDASETYERGLKQFPNSYKIMIKKASTIIFDYPKQSINLFIQATDLELKTNEKLSSETNEGIETFRTQLLSLRRTGDLADFNMQLKILLEKYPNTK